MAGRDIAAFEACQLIPRLLHGVYEVDSQLELLGLTLSSPLLPLIEAGPSPARTALSLVEATAVLDRPESYLPQSVLPLLGVEKMGELMPRVRQLAALGVPALALDMTGLADTPPYGSHGWRPRTREDLAELRAAAGRPVWLYGVMSPGDAEVAAEAGLDGVVVHSGAGLYLGSPAAIEVLPEVIDAVAGMIGIYAGGPVRSGVDVFRYLALGAEAVVADSDRSLVNLEAELHYAMRLTGCKTVHEIGYEAVFAPLLEVP